MFKGIFNCVSYSLDKGIKDDRVIITNFENQLIECLLCLLSSYDGGFIEEAS